MAPSLLHPATPPVPPPGIGHDPDLAWQWLLEAWLLRIRWYSLLLAFVFVPFFPATSRPACLLLLLALGLGNAWMEKQVDRVSSRVDLGRARKRATGMDWMFGLIWIGLSAGSGIHGVLPAVLPLLVITTALRYDLSGLLGATLGTMVILSILAGLHALLLRIPVQMVVSAWIGWAVFDMVAAFLSGGVLLAGHGWLGWERQRLAHQHELLCRLESGLSGREWTVLTWLAREDLTYEAIAAELHISPATVKAHARHIGEKLGATGRRRIVLTARRRGLLPPMQD